MNGIVEKITLVDDSKAAFKTIESGLSSLGTSIGSVTSNLSSMGSKASAMTMGSQSISASANSMSKLGMATTRITNGFGVLSGGPRKLKIAVDRINLNKSLGIPLSKAEKYTMRLVSAANSVGGAFRKAGGAIAKTGGALSKANRVMSTGKGFGVDAVARAGAAIYAGKAAVGFGKGLIDKADTYTMQSNQLGSMAPAGKSKDEFKSDVFSSAQKTGVDFVDYADMVRNVGDTVGDSFKDADQINAFTETMSKAFYVSGTMAEDQKAAMDNLVIGMGMGVLEGRKLNLMLSKAPELAKYLALELDVPKDKLMEMARAGEVTSKSLIAAVARAGDGINAQFEQMPVTWAQTTARFGNTFNEAMMPVYGSIAAFADSPEVQSFGAGLIGMIGPAIEKISTIGAMLAPSMRMIFDILSDVGFVFLGMLSDVMPLVERIVGFVAESIGSMSSMGETMEGPWKAILGLAGGVIDVVIGIFSAFQDLAPYLVEPFTYTVDAVGEVFTAIDKVLIKSGLLSTVFKSFGVALMVIKPIMIAVSFVIRQVVNLFELGVSLLEKAKDASAWVGDAVGNAMFGQSGVEYLSNGSSRSPGEKLTDNTVKIINPEDIARAIAEKENDEKIRKEHEAQLWGGTKLSDLEFKLEELLWEEQKLSSTMDKFGNLSGMDMLLGNLRDEIVNLFDLTEKARKEDAEFNKKNLRSKSKSQPVKIDKESIDLLDALARLQFVNRFTSMQPNFTQNIIMKGGTTSEYEDGGKAQAKEFMKNVANNATALGSV